MVIDHINYAVTDVEGDHTLIAGDDLIQSDVILGSKKIEVSSDAKNLHNPSDILHIFMFIGLDRVDIEPVCTRILNLSIDSSVLCVGLHGIHNFVY